MELVGASIALSWKYDISVILSNRFGYVLSTIDWTWLPVLCISSSGGMWTDILTSSMSPSYPSPIAKTQSENNLHSSKTSGDPPLRSLIFFVRVRTSHSVILLTKAYPLNPNFSLNFSKSLDVDHLGAIHYEPLIIHI